MEKTECQECVLNPCFNCKDDNCEECGFAPFRRNGTYPCGQYHCWDDCYNRDEE